MPSCNLAETVHNKWLQQSGKRGNDLYVATVDDYVRAFMQMVAYYQYLNGERPGTGPRKEELLLRVAQRTAQRSGNPKSLHQVLRNMPGAEGFCTREPHLQGEEVFLSLKRKPDLPPGSEFDSHRPDKISISRPRVQTRAGGARFYDLTSQGDAQQEATENLHDNPVQLETPPTNPVMEHVKAVQETTCNEHEWHIARLPKMSAKACFAQQAITKKKCVARIVQDGKNTAAPTYNGIMHNYRKNKQERMQFFFCNDDIERCVKGTRRKWVVSNPAVPEIWPVKIGTNLTQKEILDLENAGFRLAPRLELSPRKLFRDGRSLVDLSEYPTPEFSNDFPKRRFGKNIRRNPNAPSTKHANSCASALTVIGQILKVSMVPNPALGCIITFESRNGLKISQYLLTIGQFPSCSCPFFKDMSGKALGKRGQWTNCKHLYYIFHVVCGLDSEIDVFMHAPSFSFNEIKRVIQMVLLKQPAT